MEEDEVNKLKETIYQQQLILQKFQAELEEEREASAIATSEALSMILRLQGEKANEKMEACQYKRVAEERMRHAEESLVMFEDLLYQKELENASLRIQVHQYMDKLPHMDSDSNENEQKLPSNQILKSTNALLQDKNSIGLSRRSSLPVLQLGELCSQIDSIDRELFLARSACPAPRAPTHDVMLSKRSSSVAVDKNEEAKTKAVDFDASYTRKIQGSLPESISANNKLQRARTVDFYSTKDAHKSYSKQPSANDKSYPLNDQEMIVRLEERSASISSPQKIFLQHSLDSDAPATSSSQISRKNSPDFSPHDIVEVQQDCGTSAFRETRQSESSGPAIVERSKGTSPNQIQKDVIDTVKLEDGFKNTTPRSNLSTPTYDVETTGFQFPVRNFKSFVTSPRFDFEQFEKRLQIIEERVAFQQISERETEQLKLIKAIHKQLTEIWAYMKDTDSKKDANGRKDSSKDHVQDDESYENLIELQVMLSVSI